MILFLSKMYNTLPCKNGMWQFDYGLPTIQYEATDICGGIEVQI